MEEKMQGRCNTPIAIVGIGCRLPADIQSPDDFWEVIRDGKDVISEIPPDRWSIDTFYHSDQSKQGKMISRKGGFINGIDKFDNSFFKISPKEASTMDPQHRIILEVVHEAFEDAGILSDTLGESAGVYLAIGLHDYCIQTISDTSLINPYTLTGMAHSTAANRISYAFDLRGPSYAVDTACASSITALHLACTGILNQECDTAVVAACNAMILPETSIAFSALGALSKDDKCCPFSSTARGYVRSEGFGAIILKSMDRAIQDGDHIYALVRGSAIAANGFSTSLTKPSGSAQEYVMKTAYRRTDVALSDVYYLEAHGTGTPVGDPIEAEAIGNTFGPNRVTPLKIGSAKGNFGHNECASGITSIIKVAMMLNRKMLCPTINFVEINPTIKAADLKLQVQTKLEKLPTVKEDEIKIGLNSFGFGGAVGHVIFEATPVVNSQSEIPGRSCGWTFGGDSAGNAIIIPLSAKSKEALKDVARQWRDVKNECDALQVVSWLSTRRKHYEHRLAVVSNSSEDFKKQVDEFVESGSGEGSSVSGINKKTKICFVFPGQGQQWENMGRELFHHEEVFSQAVQQCDEIFKQLSGWSLLNDKHLFVPTHSENNTPGIDMDDPEILQPAVLFFQVGLLHLFGSWGVVPDVVVGHSLGEIAAAYACGGITLPEAVCVVYHRGCEESKMKGCGRMAALRMSLPDAEDLCKKHENLYVAAVNAPFAITVSGNAEAISEITKTNSTKAKALRVKCAFHSPFMDPMEAPFREAVKGVVKTTGPTSIPFYSTVTGRLYDGHFGVEYLWDNVRRKVSFQMAVEEVLSTTDVDVFLEIGASATLLSSVNQICRHVSTDPHYKLIPTGQREQNDYVTLLRALSKLYVAGCTIDWKHVHSTNSPWIRLPTYPWQHQTFWLEGDERRKRRLGLEDRTLKGQAGNISLEMFPFLADHIVQKHVVFPGVGFLEMMIQSAFEETEQPALSGVHFYKLLPWTVSSNGITKPLGIDCSKDGHRVEVTQNGVSYSSATIETCQTLEEPLNIEDILSRCNKRVTGQSIYERLAGLGLDYGPSFRVINTAAYGDGEIIGFLHPTTEPSQRTQLAHFDGCLQLLLFATESYTTLYLPVSMKKVRMSVTSLPRSEDLIAYARVTELSTGGAIGDIMLASNDGKVLLKAEDCVCQNITGTSTGVKLDSCLYTSAMVPAQSCFPQTSLAVEMLTEDYFQTNFSDDMELIARAELWMSALEKVCAYKIQQALACIGDVKVDPSNMGYFRMLKQVIEESDKTDVSEKYVESVLDSVQTKLPELQKEVDAIGSLQDTLSERLKQQTKTTAQPGEGTMFLDSLTTRIYHKAGADLIHRAVEEALNKKQVVRILEVENHLGGLAKYLLPSLRRPCEESRIEYMYGLCGSHSQQQLYDEFPFVKQQHLDFDSDAQNQKQQLGTFDIVICMSSTYLSEDMNTSFGSVHNLLQDCGWFFLCEVTNNSCIVDVLLDSDGQRRRRECYRLSQQGWKEALVARGFRDVVAVSSPNEFLCSIFVCRKHSAEEKVALLVQPRPRTSLLMFSDQQTTDASPLSSVLREKLSIDDEYVIHKGIDKESLLSQNIMSKEGDLVCLYSSYEGSLYQLVKLFQNIESNVLSFRRVFVVSNGDAQAVGLIRSVTNGIQTPVYSIHLDDNEHDSIESLLTLFTCSDVLDREITITKGEVNVRRVIRATIPSSQEEATGGQWQLVLIKDRASKNISMEDLGFAPLNELEPSSSQVVVKVESCALNFKDVMLSLGLLEGLDDEESSPRFGIECCGTVTKIGAEVTSFSIGDEVVGFGDHCFASHTICEEGLLVHKPTDMKWDEAAGLCVVFCTAYYSLVKRANLQKNETVLIHSACGGVGLAAIQVARMIGARIICSAGTEDKRSYLRHELGIEMVTDSRSGRFHDDVMAWTNGSGVDVVLNSLYGEKLSMGVETLAPGGRFCEIGKRDILENSNLQLSLLLENKSFISCQIDRLLKNQMTKAHELLNEVASLVGKNRSLTPIRTTVYPFEDYQDAFAITAKGNHIGRIVFSIPSEYKPKLSPSSRIFDANATYIITGGYGGLGLAFARWMCEHGARYLALVSRGGCATNAARRTVRYLEKQGTTVFGFALNISNVNDVHTLLSDLEGHPVVKGIFHLAGYIIDESLSSLNDEIMAKISEAKVEGAKHLHNLTQHLPLDVFFLMSSNTATWGHSAQPCYVAANAFLDALADERQAKGLPATSFQLGPVRGAGYLEANVEWLETILMKGSISLHITEVLQIVGRIIRSRNTPSVICLTNQDWNKTLQFCHKGILTFRHLTKAILSRLARGTTDAHREDLELQVRHKMAHLLSTAPASIDLHQPMVNYGVDSLMAVEMVAWAAKEFHISITQVEILGGMTSCDFIQRVCSS